MGKEHDEYTPRDESTGYPWLKFRTGLIDDPKYLRLTDQAKVLYFEVYLLAGKSDAGGLVLAGDDPASLDDIAFILRKPLDAIQKGLADLDKCKLLDLSNDQVMVCNFGREQGPSQADRRKAWAERQAKRRALANGEVWIDPDAEQNPDQNPEKEKEKNPEKEKEKEQNKDLKTTTENQIKNKIKRVTHTSSVSHGGVTRDITTNEEVVVFGNKILELWTDLTGKKFTANSAYLDMVKEWLDQGVKISHVQSAILKVRTVADTPMYLRDIVLNESIAESKDQNLDYFRSLSRQLKANNGGDNDVQ